MSWRVLRAARPEPCHPALPGRRERKRLGIQRGALVCCDTCKRVWEFDPYDGIAWHETNYPAVLTEETPT